RRLEIASLEILTDDEQGLSIFDDVVDRDDVRVIADARDRARFVQALDSGTLKCVGIDHRDRDGTAEPRVLGQIDPPLGSLADRPLDPVAARQARNMDRSVAGHSSDFTRTAISNARAVLLVAPRLVTCTRPTHGDRSASPPRAADPR